MESKYFYTSIEKNSLKERKEICSWQSPSNLAIVKYWGKYGRQLPSNPSISITLSEAVTTTSLEAKIDPNRKGFKLDFLFHGEQNDRFKQRIEMHLGSIHEFFPFLDKCELLIQSQNSFPHSSGIASSASSMSALALCLCDLERRLGCDKMKDEDYFLQKASFIARLGSGSACRSVYPSFGLWGALGDNVSSDLYAVPVKEYHEVFNSLRNDILIVSASEKSVSSSAGHKLMEVNPYATTRFEQAYTRTNDLKRILINGDIEELGILLESEALTLHALMMASDPSYLLIEPKTLKVINTIRSFREEKGIPIYFSLDAGPNVHIISYEKDRGQVEVLLEELRAFAVNGRILNDRIGKGAKSLN